MLFLKRNFSKIDDLESLFQEAVAAYRGVVEAVAKNLPRSAKPLSEEHRKQLLMVASGLGSHPTRAMLAESREQLEKEIKLHGQKLDQFIRQHEREVKEILAIVALMAESLADRDKQYGVRFRGIARKLKDLTVSSDLNEIRWKLSEEVAHLEKYVDSMSSDTQASLNRLHEQLDDSRRRLAGSAAGLSEAPGPPVRDRAAAVEAIEARCALGQRFSVAVFGVEKAQSLAERWGAQGLAAVERELAGRLYDKLPGMEALYRWEEGKLAAILGQPLHELAERCVRLEAELGGTYSAAVNGKRVELVVRVLSGAAEYIPGEPAEQLMERVSGALGRALVPR